MTTSPRGLGKSVPAGVRPYERVAGTWQAQLQACLHGSGLPKTARQLVLAWAGREAEAGRPRRLTSPQAARLVDCHRRTAERSMTTLEQDGWIRLVTPGSRAHRLASDYELVRERLPRFGDQIRRRRVSEAARRVSPEHQGPVKSAAKRRPPESLRTLKSSTPPTILPIASKVPRPPEVSLVPAAKEATSPETAAAVEAITQELREEGFAEGPLNRLAHGLIQGKHDTHQVQALLDACRYRWRRQEPKSRAGFFSRALQDPAMTRDLLGALPRGGAYERARPTTQESAQLAQASPTLRGQPKFMDHFLKWRRLLAAAPHADAPGYLDWFDQAQALQNEVVHHAEGVLGPRALDLQHQVKERLHQEPHSFDEDSFLWKRVFRKRYVSLVLAACGLPSPEDSPRSRS